MQTHTNTLNHNIMQNITIYPECKSTNTECTQNLAIPTATELSNHGLEVLNWSFYQDEPFIHHKIILKVPSEMLLYKFFAIIRLALDWNDAEYTCTDLKPIGNGTWEFSFKFEY